ncbi:hypothetical protein [Brevundimonas diminuta]|uniref:hypothetical protein n=1 Tax=Brevundimonas diminuta TaxID=293 RepID=UPI003F8042D7
MFPKAAIAAAMVALAACATTPPQEVRMIPTADHGVGVRFSRGNALMVSNGPSGAIMLLPVRYNDTQKFYFSVAAFNTSGYPINIGSEDIRLYLDGQPYGVQGFDYLRHTARTTAQREMNLAWADAAVEYFLTLQEMEDHPRRHDIAYRSASGQLQASHDHIQRRLRQTISTLGRTNAGDDDHRSWHGAWRRDLGRTDRHPRRHGPRHGDRSALRRLPAPVPIEPGAVGHLRPDAGRHPGRPSPGHAGADAHPRDLALDGWSAAVASDFQGHAGDRIGRSATRVSWAKQESDFMKFDTSVREWRTRQDSNL